MQGNVILTGAAQALPGSVQFGSQKVDRGRGGSREAFELDAAGKAALQLGQHVAGLALVEGPAADEQDVVRAHVAKLGAHLAALYDGQQVPLHALTARVRPCSPATGL